MPFVNFPEEGKVPAMSFCIRDVSHSRQAQPCAMVHKAGFGFQTKPIAQPGVLMWGIIHTRCEAVLSLMMVWGVIGILIAQHIKWPMKIIGIQKHTLTCMEMIYDQSCIVDQWEENGVSVK